MEQLLQEDPEKLVALLKYAATFPDFPKNFTVPSLLDPNYVPPNRSRPLEVLCYCLAGITTVVVLLRLWVRMRVQRRMFGMDDWLIIPGQILSLATIIVIILLSRVGGSGQHIYDVSYDRAATSLVLQFIGISLYFAAICIIRLSITAFLYRLISPVFKTKRILLHCTVVFIFLEFAITGFLHIFAYKPISAGWDIDVRLAGFTSINVPLGIFIGSIVYLITDVWLLIIPIHTVWTLRLSIWRRIGITWVFAFGSVACVGAILKTIYVYPLFDSYDPLWNGIGFQIGAVIELGFGVISASIPALNHILVKAIPILLDPWFSSTPINERFSSANRTTKPKHQTFQEDFSRRIRGPSGRAVEAYDNIPGGSEFNLGREARRKGA
ncbi:hypothetical protein P152DRAFT_33130 [Eremomyces bilateralis CBS 781.70]|uniref:Rhodopsin domain-containing protein n=1 Tax=Eremomyces bilateralis CBS 781.70 TaxID=1392243 RepID=A0A6G1G335_9PEZI|nr:uncharacterized protein P152DRAFT_33130 [Eremomyces bilateralis CBS 781.70]KAF1812341.1 hypothetical protein P152DRAFT_33130 [Eremomyces bilateralis CBS 781.70]